MVNILNDLVLKVDASGKITTDGSGTAIPVYVEGDAPSTLPNEYFVVSEDYTSDNVSADNKPYSMLYEFSVKYYTTDPTKLRNRIVAALTLLKSKNYITTGVGYDNGTYQDRQNKWFSKQADVEKIDYDMEE